MFRVEIRGVSRGGWLPPPPRYSWLDMFLEAFHEMAHGSSDPGAKVSARNLNFLAITRREYFCCHNFNCTQLKQASIGNGHVRIAVNIIVIEC